ncbi:MAG TPA: hypothetical protein VNJ54_00240 [Plantibacter sp.]|uniref:hypothetical protein n=1 Tax=unclassified Plantibacter TaxID=2624265 RepID=UPI002CFE9E20|nr:hypothetical protein [Plantibacter sp.]
MDISSGASGARTSSRTPAAAAVCSAFFAAGVRGVLVRAGVRFAGVRVVVDFAVVVDFSVLDRVPAFAAAGRGVVARGAFVVGIPSPCASVGPSSAGADAALAGVRFAAVVRLVGAFADVERAAVVFVVDVLAVVERAAGFFVVGADSSSFVDPAASGAGRFAGALAAPVVLPVVRGARLGGVGAAVASGASVEAASTVGTSIGARGLVGVPSAGAGCSAGSGGVVEVTKQTYQ